MALQGLSKIQLGIVWDRDQCQLLCLLLCERTTGDISRQPSLHTLKHFQWSMYFLFVKLWNIVISSNWQTETLVINEWYLKSTTLYCLGGGKKGLFLPNFEPWTLCMLGKGDNHYTTRTGCFWISPRPHKWVCKHSLKACIEKYLLREGCFWHSLRVSGYQSQFQRASLPFS